MSAKYPSVAAVMLTFDPARVEYARKAVACFNAQDYSGSIMRLIIYDSREEWRGLSNPTIGQLRNEANKLSDEDIIVHWDDDDYSHPSRISEQVALLQSSGAQCVGYSDLLFWREPGTQTGIASGCRKCGYTPCRCPGEAWLYTSPGPKPSPPGTTLCYTREFWIRNPFPATSQGEELRFLSQAKCVSVSSIGADGTPRMIARIHSGNTSTAYDPRKMAAESKKKNAAWQRVPAWDNYCAETMR